MNLKYIFFLLVVITLLSCKKSSNNSNSNSQSYLITNVGGTYNGGTLDWTISGNSFSDPNFTFNVTYIDSNTCSLTVNTIAPIPVKTFVLSLTSKDILPIGANQGQGSYGYKSLDMKTNLSLNLVETPVGFHGNGLFSYQNNSTNFQCTGTGTR